MSEGFRSLRKILRNEVGSGILELEEIENFPHPDRETFYRYSPAHRKSKIKSVIPMTGCPEQCDYCYNSTSKSTILVPKDRIAMLLGGNLPLPVLQGGDKKRHGMGERLFPLNVRPIDDVIKEGREIREKWGGETEGIYDQSDIACIDVSKGGPTEQFAKRWPKEVGFPIYNQTRWEYLTSAKDGVRRLDLMQEAGVVAITLAIESADPIIRNEVLSRRHPQEDMFEGARKITERGIRMRTEQITFLPSGTTSEETPMNEELDFKLADLNRALAEYTGVDHMAWYSTLVYYPRANITERTGVPHGFWRGGTNVKDAFFKRSDSHALKEWAGPEIGTLKKEIVTLLRLHKPIPEELMVKYTHLCEQLRNNESAWLPEDRLNLYRDRNAEFRNHGTYFNFIPQAEKLSRSYILSSKPYGLERLSNETESHLRVLASQGNGKAQEMLDRIPQIQQKLAHLNGTFRGENAERIREELKPLIPYFAVLPKGELAIQRAARYGLFRYGGQLDSYGLSTAVRHHLYDNFLYDTGEDEIYSGNIPAQPKLTPIKEERYAPKV